ncbi:MAG TPA: hypothetical protein VGE97_00290 [Nitrososphaera sp.]
MAKEDSFAVEQLKAQKIVEWMNDYAKKNNRKFKSGLTGYSMQTIKFGSFEMITWNGEWSAARAIIQKVSREMRAKVIESGYHDKGGILSALVGSASEYGKVYSNGKLVGQIEMTRKASKWIAKAESYV